MPDFDDPFRPTDFTRPRPGAGRRGSGDVAPAAVRPGPVERSERIPPMARDFLGIGLNPLVQAASPLLLLAGQLRATLSGPDVDGLRRHALEEIRRFEDRARASGVQHDVVLAARYALCATLDEAVLSTPWGAQSAWAQQPLLVTLHREAWGGEKFFEMLDRISRDPARYIDLMELQYLCVAMGFNGKYQVAERGDAQLAERQHELYRKIREHRGAPTSELSPHWRGVEDRRNPLIRYVPWWVVGAAALAILAVAFVFYYSRLESAAAPIQAALADVGNEAFSAAAPVTAPISGPTVKQLLAEDEARGTVSVEEQGGRTVITILARNLFASGSATVNPVYNDALQRVGRALARVPGRILVVGHTDDQPLKSLRYADNFELSRERAVGVSRVLQGTLDNSARLVWKGVGSSEPRYRPESEPENRARNRRVEIVHVRES